MVKNCLRRVRAQRFCRFVEAAVGQQQRSQDDHQRMRKDRVDRADHDADRSVDRVAEQQALERALVAEPLDERNRRQQRGRQNRRQRDQAKHALGRHAAPGERVGEREGQRNGDDRYDDRDEKRIGQRLDQPRRLHVIEDLAESDECAVPVLDALDQDRAERREQEQDQRRAGEQQQRLRAARCGQSMLPVGADGSETGVASVAIGRQASKRMHSGGNPTDTGAPSPSAMRSRLWRDRVTSSG